MKSYQVTYTKGHLVDQETGKRILLKRGGSFQILGDDHQFEEKDELTPEIEILGSKDKLRALEKDHKHSELRKLCDAGQLLVYRIGLSKKTKEDEAQEFLFDAELKEDLYMHTKDRETWSLCKCVCFTKSCIEGGINMFEPVYGYSLNNLFSNMVAFYFALQRSGSCNAFSTFVLTDYPDKCKLVHLKESQLKSLHQVRLEKSMGGNS